MGLLQGVSLQLKPGWGFCFVFILKEENLPEQTVSVVVSHSHLSCPCILVHLPSINSSCIWLQTFLQIMEVIKNAPIFCWMEMHLEDIGWELNLHVMQLQWTEEKSWWFQYPSAMLPFPVLRLPLGGIRGDNITGHYLSQNPRVFWIGRDLKGANTLP